MSYGLGQTDDEYIGARDVLMNFINGTTARIEGFGDSPAVQAIRAKLADAARWWQASLNRYYDGNTKDAMDSVVVGMRLVHEASAAIAVLSPADKVAAQAQAKAVEGSSITYQVGQTLSRAAEPVAGALQTIAPSVAAAVRSAPWLLPVGAVLALMAFWRRR